MVVLLIHVTIQSHTHTLRERETHTPSHSRIKTSDQRLYLHLGNCNHFRAMLNFVSLYAGISGFFLLLFYHFNHNRFEYRKKISFQGTNVWIIHQKKKNSAPKTKSTVSSFLHILPKIIKQQQLKCSHANAYGCE